jgi:hypothetical protein
MMMGQIDIQRWMVTIWVWMVESSNNKRESGEVFPFVEAFYLGNGIEA